MVWYGDIDARCRANGAKFAGPPEQLKPTANGEAWFMIDKNASGVCPDKMRPDWSEIVIERMIGILIFVSEIAFFAPFMAAFALQQQNYIVATGTIWAPKPKIFTTWLFVENSLPSPLLQCDFQRLNSDYFL